MFDQSETSEGKDRSRLVIALSGIAVLLVAALIIIVASRPSRQAPVDEWPGPGSAEFDSYAPNIVIGELDKWISGTLIGRRLATLKADVTNKGDRIVTGLKIKASAVGLGGQTLIFRNATPVPRQRETLAPGETARFEIQLDPIPPQSEIQDFTWQVTALKLK